MQFAKTPNNITRQVNYFVKHQVFNIKDEILDDRLVELVAFTLMPNHFHLIVRELGDSNVSDYMQRVLNAYAKYFNAKYDQSGHVFQGPFRAVHITDDAQLQYTSAYVHRNPRELRKWRGREHLYPWSSYQDYLFVNRWKPLLNNDAILGQYAPVAAYREFVEESGAKELYKTLSV